jgi:hypothetical protein
LHLQRVGGWGRVTGPNPSFLPNIHFQKANIHLEWSQPFPSSNHREAAGARFFGIAAGKSPLLRVAARDRKARSDGRIGRWNPHEVEEYYQGNI